MRLSLIPVRVEIHSSDVSTIRSKSALLSTRVGTALPTPKIPALIPLFNPSHRPVLRNPLGDGPDDLSRHRFTCDPDRFFTAFSLEDPWEMIQTPLMPKSGAPPYSV